MALSMMKAAAVRPPSELAASVSAAAPPEEPQLRQATAEDLAQAAPRSAIPSATAAATSRRTAARCGAAADNESAVGIDPRRTPIL